MIVQAQSMWAGVKAVVAGTARVSLSETVVVTVANLLVVGVQCPIAMEEGFVMFKHAPVLPPFGYAVDLEVSYFE